MKIVEDIHEANIITSQQKNINMNKMYIRIVEIT